MGFMMKEHLFNALSEYLEEDESVGGYKYKNTKTGEIFTYTRKGVYRKGGRVLIYVGKATEDNKR